MLAKVRRHIHFMIIVAVLAVVMTWPTAKYVFKTDVLWLPNNHKMDILMGFWNVWYASQVLTGQADFWRTDLIFYPEGASLAYHPVFYIHGTVSNALRLLLPTTNVFNLLFLIIIMSSAAAAYVYIHWLMKDRWLAAFGGVIFGFCAQVIGYPHWPTISWLALMPLIFYCLHRGIRESRAMLIVLAGLLVGLSSTIIMYYFVCALMAAGLLLLGLAATRWRERQFWLRAALFIAVVALWSLWRVPPMLQDREARGRVDYIDSSGESSGDPVGFILNVNQPILGDLVWQLLDAPENNDMLRKSYLGILPLMLIGLGLASRTTRRRMLPWLGMLLFFLTLCLGEELTINGTSFEGLKLPKYYLSQLLRPVFAAFYRPSLFMFGAWLPLAVLACFGLAALRRRSRLAAKPAFALALIALVAFEYYIPINATEGSRLTYFLEPERTAYLDWLAQEDRDDIALVNLPFSWHNAQFYSYTQSLSGYPISEGATSRPRDSRYDYIRSNYLLSAWHSGRVRHCETADRQRYLEAVDSLEATGFSHVVYHRDLIWSARISESFVGIHASYSDSFVSIYRLDDLRASCPSEPGVRHQYAAVYAEAIGKLDERHGLAVVLPPTDEIGQHFIRHLRHNGYANMAALSISSDQEGQIAFHSADAFDIEASNALWLVTDRRFAPESDAVNYAWLLEHFKHCARHYADENAAIALYLKLDMPCAAMDEGSAVDARYEADIHLRNAMYKLDGDELRVYLAWTIKAERPYSFSLRLLAADGQLALQYDHLIRPRLLSDHAIDVSQLEPAEYALQLVVYDYETLASQEGRLVQTGENFGHALDLGKIEIDTNIVTAEA